MDAYHELALTLAHQDEMQSRGGHASAEDVVARANVYLVFLWGLGDAAVTAAAQQIHTPPADASP
jgi:hypothetical protein